MDTYIFIATGEGTTDAVVCAGRDDVRKAYITCVCGSEDAAHQDEIELFMEKFDDEEGNFNGGWIERELYCATVTIIKIDNLISLDAQSVAERVRDAICSDMRLKLSERQRSAIRAIDIKEILK